MKAPAMITHGEKGSNLGLFDEPDRMQSKLWRTESQEKAGLASYVNKHLGGHEFLEHLLPVDAKGADVFNKFHDGVLLCRLVCLAFPSAIADSKINVPSGSKTVKMYKAIENVNTALTAAEAAGLRVVNIGAADIINGRPASILGLSWQLIRVHIRTQMELKVASGQVGVTSDCMANLDPIQSKIAQGARPTEGDELPGSKVTTHMAENRHTTPGVGLISLPPNHDTHSIVDSTQLIHELRNANPNREVSVKPVFEVGVGVMAAGVAKAKAVHMTVSGHDGGTGAAPCPSPINLSGDDKSRAKSFALPVEDVFPRWFNNHIRWGASERRVSNLSEDLSGGCCSTILLKAGYRTLRRRRGSASSIKHRRVWAAFNTRICRQRTLMKRQEQAWRREVRGRDAAGAVRKARRLAERVCARETGRQAQRPAATRLRAWRRGVVTRTALVAAVTVRGLASLRGRRRLREDARQSELPFLCRQFDQIDHQHVRGFLSHSVVTSSTSLSTSRAMADHSPECIGPGVWPASDSKSGAGFGSSDDGHGWSSVTSSAEAVSIKYRRPRMREGQRERAKFANEVLRLRRAACTVYKADESVWRSKLATRSKVRLGRSWPRRRRLVVYVSNRARAEGGRFPCAMMSPAIVLAGRSRYRTTRREGPKTRTPDSPADL